MLCKKLRKYDLGRADFWQNGNADVALNMRIKIGN